MLEFSLSLPSSISLGRDLRSADALLESPDPLFDAFDQEGPQRPGPDRKSPKTRTQRRRARFVPLFALGVLALNCGRESSPRVAADSILVQLRDRSQLPDWARADESAGLLIPIDELGDSLDGDAPLLRFPVPAGIEPGAFAAQLSRDPAVEFAEEIPLYAALSRTPDDPRFGNQWGLAEIGAPAAWETSTGSRAVAVAVIDDGVALSHPDLAANAWTNPNEVAANGLDDDGDGIIDDVHGASFLNGVASGDLAPDAAGSDPWHGTRVAGVIGAVGDNRAGVAGANWQTSLMPIRALSGSGGRGDDLVQAIDYASSHGARVINASWGEVSAKSQALGRAIERAGRRGALFVAAAGNDGASSPGFPAASSTDNLISVGALDVNGLLAPFSNRGAMVAAPGVGILSTSGLGSYERADGTSLAAPFVSGLAALLFAAHPEKTPARIREVILDSAIAIPGVVHGRIAAGRAMALLASPVGDAPGGLTLSRDSIEVSAAVGSTPRARVIAIRSRSGAAVEVAATSSASWASSVHRDFTTPARATIRLDPGGLASGEHTAVIAFTSAAGESASVRITLRLGDEPVFRALGEQCAISSNGTLHVNRGSLCTLVAPGYGDDSNAPQIAWSLPDENTARRRGARLSAIFPKRGNFTVHAQDGSERRAILVIVE